MFFKRLLLIIICLTSLNLSAKHSLFDSTEMQQLPVLYKGRIRPQEAAARLWFYEISHKEHITAAESKRFMAYSAADLLWKLNFFGHKPWDHAPFFWLDFSPLKTLLELDLDRNRFSYRELTDAIYTKQPTNQALVHALIRSAFLEAYFDTARRSSIKKIELTSLAPGLWTALDEGNIIIAAVPAGMLWQSVKAGDRLGSILNETPAAAKKIKQISQKALSIIETLQHFSAFGEQSRSAQNFETAYQKLTASKLSAKEIQHSLQLQFPVAERLAAAGGWLHLLPVKNPSGQWVNPGALTLNVLKDMAGSLSMTPITNFTLYPQKDFEKIQQLYLDFEHSVHQAFTTADQGLVQNSASRSVNQVQENASLFASQLLASYSLIAGTEQMKASGKSLAYPTLGQLKMEALSYRLPLIELAITAYTLAACAFAGTYDKKRKYLFRSAIALLILGFAFHSMSIAVRCYILHRPPVSNMFESVIYVPWITVLASLALRIFFKSNVLLLASSAAAAALLIVLHLTNLNSSMENVQAVLDSQYWLIVHVLMVVGSYGLYVLAGLLGHFYLAGMMVSKKETPLLAGCSKLILQSMYIGTALLIPGTILGGIWAAESWGRFWDWDPKESWAFISGCVYLIWIHAYRFGLVHHFGLAIGAVTGLITISFTWYGVNYILGTGLHSYGFGNGGEQFYYLYLFAELIFLCITFFPMLAKKWTLR